MSEHLTRQFNFHFYWKSFTISFGSHQLFFTAVTDITMCSTDVVDAVLLFQITITDLVVVPKRSVCSHPSSSSSPSPEWRLVCETGPRMPSHSLCRPQFSQQHWPGLPIALHCIAVESFLTMWTRDESNVHCNGHLRVNIGKIWPIAILCRTAACLSWLTISWQCLLTRHHTFVFASVTMFVICICICICIYIYIQVISICICISILVINGNH